MAITDVPVQIIDNSAKFIEAFNKQVENGCKAIGMTAEKYAKAECPVDTGRLRGSITYATASHHSSGKAPAEADDYAMKGKPEGLDIYIGTNVEYASYVEYIDKYTHTPGTKAHFLRDAATTHNKEYEKIMKMALISETGISASGEMVE